MFESEANCFGRLKCVLSQPDNFRRSSLFWSLRSALHLRAPRYGRRFQMNLHCLGYIIVEHISFVVALVINSSHLRSPAESSALTLASSLTKWANATISIVQLARMMSLRRSNSAADCGFPWRIRICLKMVDFPDSPQPRRRSLIWHGGVGGGGGGGGRSY